MKCLTELCYNEASCRGLCHQCYQSYSQLVKYGAKIGDTKLTWEHLEEHNSCLPSKGIGRPRGSIGKTYNRKQNDQPFVSLDDLNAVQYKYHNVQTGREFLNIILREFPGHTLSQEHRENLKRRCVSENIDEIMKELKMNVV